MSKRKQSADIKLAIVGSRTFTIYEQLEKELHTRFSIADIVEIISGGAQGTDTLAEKFADTHNIKLSVIKADWKRYGRSAGAVRNRQIVDRCTAMIAFWNGSSPGTRITIDMARNAQVDPLEVVKI